MTLYSDKGMHELLSERRRKNESIQNLYSKFKTINTEIQNQAQTYF